MVLLKICAWILGLAIAACLIVAAWPQMLGMEQWPIIAQVVSMRMGVVGIALVLAVLFALLLGWKAVRPFAATIVAMLLVFALVSGGVLLSRGIASADALAVEDGDILVLSWNTLGDAPGVDGIASVIRDTGADVVMLPETTEATGVAVAQQLAAEGNPFWVHTSEFDPGYGALNTTLLISASLGEYTTDTSVGQTRTLPTIVATPDDGTGPTFVATHPVAPIPQQMRNWRADLQFVADLCSGSSMIMAGDFNSTVDHWAQLGVDGGDIGACSDAATATGAGAVGTWPTWAPAWIGSQIDHVVATDDWTPIATQIVQTVDGSGSDHRPVLVQLRATA